VISPMTAASRHGTGIDVTWGEAASVARTGITRTSVRKTGDSVAANSGKTPLVPGQCRGILFGASVLPVHYSVDPSEDRPLQPTPSKLTHVGEFYAESGLVGNGVSADE
jgi:hypothetical protein